MKAGILLFITLNVYVCHCFAENQSGEMEELIVSATRSENGFSRTAGLITVITKEQIKLSGATHLVDVLRSTGGVQVSDLFGDGTDSSVGLRGFSETAQQNTLIMIDGRRLNNADNGLPDLNTIALRNIERIEIVKGSSGTLYGDKAVGGIINIITRSPEKLRMNMETVLGSYNRKSIFADIENRHSNGIGYRLNTERRLSENYRDNNGLQLTDVYGKFEYDHNDGKLFIEYEDLNEDARLPGALFKDLVVADRKQTLNPDDFVNTDTQVFRLGGEQRLSRHLSAVFEYTNRLSGSNGIISSSGFPSPIILKRHHFEYTPRLIGTFETQTGRSLITAGIDIFKTDYYLRSDFGLTVDTQYQYGIYAQGIFPVTRNIDLTIGGRYAEVKNDILVDTLCCGRSLPAGSEIDDSVNAYEFGISYQIDPKLRLFAKADKNFRFVTADEYSAIADNNFFGAPFLPFPETQTGFSYEVGLDWSFKNKSVKLLFYQLDLEDEIVFVPTAGVNTNIGDTQRRGIIFEGFYAPVEKWQIFTNYSFIDSEVTSGPFTGSELTFIADHTLHLATNYQFNRNISGYLELNAISDRVFAGDFTNSFSDLPGYLVSNANVSYKWDKFKLSFRINNLLDKEYSDSGAIGFEYRDFSFDQVETFFPSPERNFLFTLSYNYD